MFTLTVRLKKKQLRRLCDTIAMLGGTLGDRMAEILDPVRAALDSLESTLATELTEIAAALANASTPIDPAEVQAIADRVLALRDRVANIIP